MRLNFASDRVRSPAVAGIFYPNDPDELGATIQRYLEEAENIFEPAVTAPKAIIAPHAGYIYSGLTAAAVYNRLRPAREIIKRVIILGPCHKVAVRGLALPNDEIFRTPLGDVQIDMAAVQKLKHLAHVNTFNETHIEDHSIEIHLPFLQKIIGEFKLVPLIVGEAGPEQVSQVLEILWGGAETLILISSDLSHYLDYDEAKSLDDHTRQAIERMDLTAIDQEQACGRHSIKGLLSLARNKGLSVKTADIRNSGDTAGTKERVVGYGSWYFDENSNVKLDTQNKMETITNDMLEQYGSTLLHAAASAILKKLSPTKIKKISPKESDNILNEPGASFVTLNKKGRLRGCIGSIQAWQPLIDDITQNACKAAFEDSRFQKLSLEEIKTGEIEISISILSPQIQMYFSDELDLLAQIRPGIDGIVLTEGIQYRGVFLPAVWDQIPDPKQFIHQLKRKSGLPENYWSGSIQAWRFSAASASSVDLAAENVWGL